LGVSKHLIPPNDITSVNNGSDGVDSNFLPRGSPIDVIDALKLMIYEEKIGKFVSESFVGDNTFRDLSALGLAVRVGDGNIRTAKDFGNIDRAVRRAASIAPSMKVARAVLMTNPEASAFDIADAVSVKLNRDWTNPATKRRRGNALRRWSLWLENYLIDTDVNPDAEVLIDYAKSTKRRAGGPTKVTRERANEARRLLATGMSKRKVAKTLNVTNPTLRKILDAFEEE
jgi:hypothetical protein